MQRQGLTPDVVTYTAIISAYEKGGQWRLALSAYEQMRERGCRPDAIVFNAVIDALWETGVIWAQRKVSSHCQDICQGKAVRGVHRSCPDGIVLNANIDALWDTGVISTQRQGGLLPAHLSSQKCLPSPPAFGVSVAFPDGLQHNEGDLAMTCQSAVQSSTQCTVYAGRFCSRGSACALPDLKACTSQHAKCLQIFIAVPAPRRRCCCSIGQ